MHKGSTETQEGVTHSAWRSCAMLHDDVWAES